MLRDPSGMLIVGLVRTWVDFGDIGEPSRGVALGDEFRATLTQGKAVSYTHLTLPTNREV